MLEFSASVLSGEAPVYDGDGLIALMLQRRDLSLEYHLVADSTVEALVAEDTQLNLSHVQPTAMYWSKVKLQALGDAPGFGWVKGIIQRTQDIGYPIETINSGTHGQ